MKKTFTIFIISALSFLGCTDKLETGEFSKIKVGDRVPEFTITDLEGLNPYSSREEGKPVLIYMLWSECGDCKKATPAVMDVWESIMEDNTVRLVCLARGGSYASLESAKTYWEAEGVKMAPTPMPSLYYDVDRRIYDQFASQGVPRFYVIDGNGVVRWQKEGVVMADVLTAELKRAKLPLEPQAE